MSGQQLKTILIVGATGKQGGACIDQLLNDSTPYTLRALTRNTESSSAKKLAARGVQLIKGDLVDLPSLKPALTGCDAAFLMTYPLGSNGAEGEVTQGKNFIDAAVAAGIKHLVFTSVGAANAQSNVPHFDSKYEVEKHLQASGLQYTILRPVAFMDNIPMTGVGRFLVLGVFDAMLLGKKLQWVATEDIGVLAAKALEYPEKFNGKAIELAGDDLTVEDMLQAFERVTGVRPWRAWLPGFVINIMPYDVKMMFRFFREAGYTGDIQELKKIHPGLMTYEDYVRKHSKRE